MPIKEYNISTIINFCSNDSKFLDQCIDGVRPFSDKIYISYLDKFADLSKENLQFIQEIIHEYYEDKQVDFIMGWADHALSKNPHLYTKLGSRYLHNYQRYIGYQAFGNLPHYIFFLDVDEIVDSTRFTQWLDTEEYKKYDVMSFKCHWYFREPQNQAIQNGEQCGTLVKSSIINPLWLLDAEYERGQIKRNHGSNILERITGIDGKPMLHHYSWVRTKEEMLKKVSTWGHSGDKNWKNLVETEFEHPFNGKDFVHNYEYKIL